jgi:phosphatidylglycerol:prolipoprotein diacylglycerol transferase
MLSFINWNVSPEIFTIPEFAGIGPIPVRWYGLLFALGFIFGQQIMIYVFKQERKPLADIDTLTLYMLFSTVLGARIGHFLFYEPSVLIKNPLEVILPPYAGLASHGAGIGILIGLWMYSRSKQKTGQTFWWVADRIAMTVALGGAFIRLGNLMNSEIIGKETSQPWGFIFHQNHEFSQVPRHPTGIYEAAAYLILFVVLYGLWKRYKEKTPGGLLVGILLVGVFTARFIIEFFKENQAAFEDNLTLNMGQNLSIPAILLGIWFIWRALNNKNTTLNV